MALEGVIEEKGFQPARFWSSRCRDRCSGATVIVVKNAPDTERSIHSVSTIWEHVVDKAMGDDVIVLLANDVGRRGFDRINQDGSAAGHWTSEEAERRLSCDSDAGLTIPADDH